MADEAYRAVFLRVHPTGKMVLSLTTDSDGKEAEYAQLVADELGVPALDVKVVARRHRPVRRRATATTRARPTARRRRSPAPPPRSATRRSCSPAWRWTPPPDTLKWFNGAWVERRRRATPRRSRRSRTSPSTRTAPARCRPGVEGGLDAQAVYRD